MSADIYTRPDGTMVIDFTPPPGVTPAAARKTLKRCTDCGRLCDGAVPDGEHAPHPVDGVRVNCIGAAIF